MDRREEALRLYKKCYHYCNEEEERMQYRGKITELLFEFLSLTSPKDKFLFKEFPQILTESSKNLKKFDTVGAANAFFAMERLIIVVVGGCWKLEYQQLKLYGGYIQTRISCFLVNVHFIIQKMGMEEKSPGLYEFPGIPKIELLTMLAFECLVAALECEMSSLVRDSLQSYGISMSSEEVVHWRTMLSGNVDQNVVALRKMNVNYKEPGVSGITDQSELSFSKMRLNSRSPVPDNGNNTFEENRSLEPSKGIIVNTKLPTHSVADNLDFRPVAENVPRPVTSGFDNRKPRTAFVMNPHHRALHRTTYSSLTDPHQSGDYNGNIDTKSTGKAGRVKDASKSVERRISPVGSLDVPPIFSQWSREESATYETTTFEDHMTASVSEVSDSKTSDVTSIEHRSSSDPIVSSALISGSLRAKGNGNDIPPPDIIAKRDAENSIKQLVLKKNMVGKVVDPFISVTTDIPMPPANGSYLIDSAHADNKGARPKTIVDLRSKSEPIMRKHVKKSPVLSNLSSNPLSPKLRVQRHSSLGSPLSPPIGNRQRPKTTIGFSYEQIVNAGFDVSHDEWVCSYCTMINDVTSPICRICSKSRDGVDSTDDPRSGDSKKICEQCTLENDFNSTSCAACYGALKTIHTYV